MRGGSGRRAPRAAFRAAAGGALGVLGGLLAATALFALCADGFLHALPAAQGATPTPTPTATPAATPDALDSPRPFELRMAAVEGAGLRVDPQDYRLRGSVTAFVVNDGTEAITEPLNVLFFEDRDLDGALSAADLRLAEVGRPGIGAGERVTLSAALSGSLSFRDNRLFAMVDPGDRIPEADEGNNVAHSAARCLRLAEPGDLSGRLAPRLRWRWPPEEGGIAWPSAREVEMAPLVVDLDGQPPAEVLFVTRDKEREAGGRAAGILRAVSGADGSALWSAGDAALLLSPFITPATADLDGDGRPEIVGAARDLGALLAFAGDGSLRWRRPLRLMLEDDTRISIADLEADGRPEILAGGAVLEGADGTIRFGGDGAAVRLPGALAFDADLDLLAGPGEGRGLEIASGEHLYDARGSVLRSSATLMRGSYTQVVADIDRDGLPDLVDVQREGGPGNEPHQLRIVDARTGRELWRTPFPAPDLAGGRGARGGPPAVADFDGDGWPDVAVAGQRRLGVFRYRHRHAGDEGWSIFEIDDDNSGKTAVSAFDLDGDGRHELAYTDEHAAWLLRLDGDRLHAVWSVPSPSTTFREMPVFADVDADGRGELVLPTGQDTDGGRSGLRVFGHPDWAPARPIWNQHAYHGAHIRDDGGVPAAPRPSWLAHNSFRAQPPRWGPVGARPDLSVGGLAFSATQRALTVTARIGNGGLGPSLGAVATFREDGRVFATLRLTDTLLAGASRDLRAVLIPAPAVGESREIEVEVALPGEVGLAPAERLECAPRAGEDNNRHRRRFDAPRAGPSATPPEPGPSATPSPTGATPPRPVHRAHLPLVLARDCGAPAAHPLDLVIVLDGSPSMRVPGPGGLSPTAGAREALEALTLRLPLPPAGDRLALVRYADGVDLRVPLGAGREALRAALERPHTGRWSRLDRGLAEAGGLLSSAPARPSARPVLLLLSDGGTAPAPPIAALEAADDLRGAGVDLFVVALGDPAGWDTLRAVAGDAWHLVEGSRPDRLEVPIATALRRARCLPERPWPAR